MVYAILVPNKSICKHRRQENPTHNTYFRILAIVAHMYSQKTKTEVGFSCFFAGKVHRNCTTDGWTDLLVPHEDACSYTLNEMLHFIEKVPNIYKVYSLSNIRPE